MMRNIVLDTNSLIIAISAKNDCHKVWQSFLNGDYTLCISNEILEEYLEVMTRNINKYVAEAIIYTDSYSRKRKKINSSLPLSFNYSRPG